MLPKSEAFTNTAFIPVFLRMIERILGQRKEGECVLPGFPPLSSYKTATTLRTISGPTVEVTKVFGTRWVLEVILYRRYSLYVCAKTKSWRVRYLLCSKAT